MEDNPKTVLIANVHSSRNIGDQALLESAFMILRMAFGKPRLLVSVNWPDEPYFKQADGFETFPSPLALVGGATNRSKWKQALGILRGSLAGWLEARGFHGLSTRIGGPGWNRLFQAYRDADLIVGVSGNIFLSTGKFGWPFLTGALSVELAHWFRKPFYVLPQSIGPLKRNWERKLLRSIYGRARQVFLRDQVSLRVSGGTWTSWRESVFCAGSSFCFTG